MYLSPSLYDRLAFSILYIFLTVHIRENPQNGGFLSRMIIIQRCLNYYERISETIQDPMHVSRTFS